MRIDDYINKCENCGRVLSGYFDFRRTFYKCVCGARYEGFKPKNKGGDLSVNRNAKSFN